MVKGLTGKWEATVSRGVGDGLVAGTGGKFFANKQQRRRTGGLGLRVATKEWEPGVAIARAAKERGPPLTELNRDSFAKGRGPDPLAGTTTIAPAAQPLPCGRHPSRVPCAGGAQARREYISHLQAEPTTLAAAQLPVVPARTLGKKQEARTTIFENGAVSIARTPE